MEMETAVQRNTGKRRKQGIWIGLLAGAVALSGCASAGAGAPQAASFVLSEDVKAEIRSMESPLLDGQLLPLDEELPYSDILSIKNGTMLFNKKKGFYAVNIEEGGNDSPKQLLDVPAIAVSENGKKVLHGFGISPYILDLDTGESKAVQLKSSEPYEGKSSPTAYTDIQFADAEGRYIVIQRDIGVIAIADTATDEVHTIMLEKYLGKSYGYRHDFKVFQNELYMPLSMGQGQHDDLYKINLDSYKFEPVLVSDQLYVGGYQPLADGTLLFSGQFQGEDGIFIYDPATGKSTTLIGEPDTDEGRLTYAFSLSPDESRILIHDVVIEDVAVAELKNGKLLNKRVVLKGYSLYALIWLMSSWNEDGNDFYIKLGYDEGGSSTDAVNNIVKFKSAQ